jgi:ABC-2 type transport system permease protein
MGLVTAIPAIAFGAVTFMVMGQAIAALVRKPTTVNGVTMTLLFPMMFLGNLWMPINQVPEVLQAISKILPSTMAVDVVRVPMLSGQEVQTTLPLYASFLGLAAYLALALAISVRYFKWR